MTEGFDQWLGVVLIHPTAAELHIPGLQLKCCIQDYSGIVQLMVSRMLTSGIALSQGHAEDSLPLYGANSVCSPSSH